MSRKIITFWLVFVPTIVLFYLGLYLSLLLRYGGQLNPESWSAHLQAFTPVYAVWLLVFFIHGLFEGSAFRRYTSLIFNLISALAVSFFVSIIYFYVQPYVRITPRRTLLILVVVNFVLILGWYLLAKYFLQKRLSEGVYLFSFQGELEELEKTIKEHGYLGYFVKGHLNQDSLLKTSFDSTSGIVLPGNLEANPQVAESFYKLRTLGVRFYEYKNFYEELLRRVYLSQINEVWFLANINYREKRFYLLVKRIVDILAGALSFLVFLISFPFIALVIKLTSKGPVFFIQQRVGKNGKVFKVYKYRTMNSWGPTNTWTSVNDPRITKSGKFLRKSRLDELPQCINLLIGNMSLVGPRPEQPHIVEELKNQIPFYDERHLVKPGLTGWAQINNVYAASLEETKLKLQYDLYYIKYRSFLFDLEIILKTIYYIFTWKGR